MDNIEDIVKNVIKEIEPKAYVYEDNLEQIWQGILEDKEKKHTQIEGIKETELCIIVDSPAWLYQMKLRKIKILKDLNEQYPQITSIRFKIGRLK